MQPLTDEQVRRFIADGFLVLDGAMAADFHAAVADEVRFAMRHESPHPGDNVLPRIPMVQDLLDSPVIRGAVASVLGPDFAWTPHRALHNSEPLDESARGESFDPFENGPRMGKGSLSGSGWHQDGHSRAGRSRWHTFRAANLFYFPHDVPLAMGPTRLLAGSHLYANLYATTPRQVVLRPMAAGSVVLTDFDIGHAGTPNRSAESRYMLKFVALRQSNPSAPAWDHHDAEWCTPPGRTTPHDLPAAWRSLWNWLRAAPRQEGIAPPATAPSALLDAMATVEQGQRLQALYDLAALGATAVAPLIEGLLASAGGDLHASPSPRDPSFHGYPKDPLERRFTHRQFTPADATVALGAIGEPAAGALVDLLRHADPWIRMNAAYGLGEASPTAENADRVGVLLDDPESAVVRVAIDALCTMPMFGADTVQRLNRLLTTRIHAWQVPAMGEHWTVQDQVRYAAAWALTARAVHADAPPDTEAALVAALADDTGYVPAAACEGLRRLGTTSALDVAVRYLERHRWDPVHHRFWRASVKARQAA